jgi:amino acid transporter
VKELGLRDHFLISQGIVILINGFIPTALFAPYFFPGANLYIVFALGAVPAICMAYVYGKLSAGMPRSGGDYVWSARVVGPLYATIQMVFIVTGLLFYSVINLWFMFDVALGPSVFGIGAATQSTALTQLGTNLASVAWGYPLSFVVLVAIILIALLGIRVYSLFCRITVPLYFVICAAFTVGVLLIPTAAFPAVFDKAMSFAGYANETYSAVLSQSTASGISATSFSMSNTLLAAIPWGFFTYIGFNWSSYSAGETKKVKTSIFDAYFLSVILTVIVLEIMTLIYYNTFTTGFVNSLAYVAGVNPSAFPVLPYGNFLLALYNPPLGAIVCFGLFLGWMINSIGLIIFASRMLFAGAMDRILPTRLADVSDRFHCPHVATIVMGVLSAIYLTIYWEFGAISTFLNSSVAVPAALALPLLAAFLFPIIKPGLYNRLYGSMKGAVAMSLTGLIGAAAIAFYVFSETSPLVSGTFLGASLDIAYEFVLALGIVAVMIYLLGRQRMKAAGVDPRAVFSEIPPE